MTGKKNQIKKHKEELTFAEYEKKAKRTDQFKGDKNRSLENSLANLLQEALRLEQIYQDRPISNGKEKTNKTLTQYYHRRLLEKTGDLLWYLTNIARLSNFTLGQVADENLKVIEKRFGKKSELESSSSDHSKQLEELPSNIDVAFIGQGRYLVVATQLKNGEFLQLGDRINDNADLEDWYRYHDAFHLAYMAILGWSPVMRSLFKRKRKSNKRVDEIEDGARAGDLEEALTAYIFEYARRSDWFRGHSRVSFELLQTIEHLTAHLEVSGRTYEEWERAIIEGYEIFEALKKNNGGVVHVDRTNKKISFYRKENASPSLQEIFKHYENNLDEAEVAKLAQSGIDAATEKLEQGRKKAKTA